MSGNSVSGNGYFVRLAAVLVVAGGLGASIANPEFSRKAAARAASAKVEKLAAEERACALAEAPLTEGFAPIDEVLSVTPLGARNAPGEDPPTPYLRVTAKATMPNGRITAIAPGKGEIVAIVSRGGRDEGSFRWDVRFKPCDKVTIFFNGLEGLDPVLLRRAGGERAFGALRDGVAAAAVRVKLDAGDTIGIAHSFDVGLTDERAPAGRHAHTSFSRASVTTADDASPLLARALAFDESRSRCAIDYMSGDLATLWKDKLGDAAGVRLPRGETGCAVKDSGSDAGVLGVWYTDSSHNARANKVSAVAFSFDLLDRDALVFALHGRLASLAAGAKNLKGALTAEVGGGRLNAAFDEIAPNETYCYEGVRAGFDGQGIDGVLLMRVASSDGARPLLKLEVRDNANACFDLPEPWSFSGNETSFYR